MANAIERRFQLAEQQLRRQETAREQQEKEALRRRFAAMGGLASGAAIKSEMLAGEAASKRLAEGRGALEMAKLSELSQQEQIEAQRAFQRRERESAQQFATGERSASQQFATGERAGAQEFAGSQAEMQRQAEAQARKEEADLAMNLQTMKNEIENKKVEIAQGELEMSEIVSAFNMGNTLPFKEWLAENYGGSAGFTGSTGSITDNFIKASPSESENLKAFLETPNLNSLLKMPDELFFGGNQKGKAQAAYEALINQGRSPDMIEIKLLKTGNYPWDPKYMVEVREKDVQPGEGTGLPFGGIASQPPPPPAPKPKPQPLPNFKFDFKLPGSYTPITF